MQLIGEPCLISEKEGDDVSDLSYRELEFGRLG